MGVQQIQSDGDDRRIFLVGKFGRYFLAIYVGIFSVKIHIVPRARTAAASNTGEDTLNNGLYSYGGSARRSTFFRLQVYERAGISLDEV